MSGLTKPEYGASRGSKASSISQSSRYHPYDRNDSSRSGGGDRDNRGSTSSYGGSRGSTGGYSRGGGSSGGGGYRGGGGRDRDSRSSSFRSNDRNGGGSRFDDRFKTKKFGKKPENEFGIKFGEIGSKLPAVDWSKQSLQSFQRSFYKPTESTLARSTQDVDEWKKEHDIECFVGYQESLKKGANGGDYQQQSWNKKWDTNSESTNGSVNTNTESQNASKKPTKELVLPTPIIAFNEAGFPAICMEAIKRAGFEKPTPIQCATWPMTLSGHNVIGIAQTGSGKTLAFLLPAVTHIKAQSKLKYGDGPIALVIAPTRELACQIEGEFDKFSCGLKHCCVYGGVKKWDQKRKLKFGVEIIIATPGRLLDFLESGVTNLRRVTYVCIDEADRLLDMGFEPQLTAILNQVRPDKQIMMFSATWPKEVRSLAKKFLKIDKQYCVPDSDEEFSLMQVAMGSTDSLKANKMVTQIIRICEKHEKIRVLKQLIDEEMKGKDAGDKDGKEASDGKPKKKSKILVFISTKKMCNNMQDILWNDGYWVCAMHGDKEQKQRDRALSSFKKGEMQIMLATDVASRGIHVDDINLVINFDFPTQIEDYVHRIGRTGRAGNKGKAVSIFVKDDDGYRAKDLIKILGEANQEIPEALRAMKHMKNNKKYGRYGRGYRGYGGGGGGGGRRW